MTDTVIASTVERHPNQSKWGWHPCSREQFLKLKELHKLILRERVLTKRNDRYFGKLEHNRRGMPPVENCVDISKRFYLEFLEAYQNARHPVASQADVKPLKFPYGYDTVIDAIKKHYSVQ